MARPQSSRSTPAQYLEREACPCGGLAFEDCCARYLERGDIPPTAEALMRSRYTAFVRHNTPYLLDTWAARTRPATLDFDDAPQWLGLQVKAHLQRDDNHAEVEFVARYKVGGRAHRLHERSRFERSDDGRWRYIDGDLFD
ncbi:MAG: YchJ family metal-binding protein [Pandoraea sp.]|nr:YchJ family metal-binding protein [Pandoraea sp.]MDR3396068.1 YchJ family metal-binding protein [Pandoraea sp.]